jgi:hypothetical protein
VESKFRICSSVTFLLILVAMFYMKLLGYVTVITTEKLYLGYGKNKHTSSSCSSLFLQLVGYDMYLCPLCIAVSCAAERNCIDNSLIPTYCVSYYGLFYFTHSVINPPIPVAERLK